MSMSIFNTEAPLDIIEHSFDIGYGIRRGIVSPEFSVSLLTELQNNGMFWLGGAINRGEPGVYHNERILDCLEDMPLLESYINELNDGISLVTGMNKEHLTYLTVRACPVGEMSTNIHRNDRRAGPWLVSLVLDGSGSFKVYDDAVLNEGVEIKLSGDSTDPKPIASSNMTQGDACALYSGNIVLPHAGGRNTSEGPKILLLLYGWDSDRV